MTEQAAETCFETSNGTENPEKRTWNFYGSL